MAIDATFVSPGILPPIISTTPNSPTVCANVSTRPDNMEDLILGNKTFKSVCHLLLPSEKEASLSVGDNADDMVNKSYAPYGLLDKKEKSTFHRMLSEKILETIGNSKNFKSKFEGKQNTITTVKTVKDKQQNLFINA